MAMSVICTVREDSLDHKTLQDKDWQGIAMLVIHAQSALGP